VHLLILSNIILSLHNLLGIAQTPSWFHHWENYFPRTPLLV